MRVGAILVLAEFAIVVSSILQCWCAVIDISIYKCDVAQQTLCFQCALAKYQTRWQMQTNSS